MRSIAIITVSLCTIAHCYSQSASIDSTRHVASLRHAVEVYTNFVRGQELFLNGSAYVEPTRTNDTHPYFQTEEWQLGSVVFQGQSYSNMLLLYEAYSDKVITETSNGQLIVICPEKLTSFTINSRKFIRIDNAQVKNSLPATGNYELLYDGPTRVIALRAKSRHENISQQTVDIIFDDLSRYYILKNSIYHPVKSKRALLKVLGEQRSTLRSFMQRKSIRFKRDKAYAISQVASFYDSLIQR